MGKSHRAQSRITCIRAEYFDQILGYGIDLTGIDITLGRYLKLNTMSIVHFLILDLTRIVRTQGIMPTAWVGGATLVRQVVSEGKKK
jgi:hypothetical protein